MKVKNADEFYKILERKAIYPVFQPIVNLQTGDVAGIGQNYLSEKCHGRDCGKRNVYPGISGL